MGIAVLRFRINSGLSHSNGHIVEDTIVITDSYVNILDSIRLGEIPLIGFITCLKVIDFEVGWHITFIRHIIDGCLIGQLLKRRLDYCRNQLLSMDLNPIILLEDGMIFEIGSKILPTLGHMLSSNSFDNLC